jgi:hypothetical protein
MPEKGVDFRRAEHHGEFMGHAGAVAADCRRSFSRCS